ncbi:MAG: DUF4296 domain-containing protein [Bacteroidota bacterium]
MRINWMVKKKLIDQILIGAIMGLSIGICGCDEEESIPKDAIPFEQMEEILLEFHIAEAIAGKKGGAMIQRHIMREDLHVEVLEKFGLDKETFFRSYEYYLLSPSVLDSLYGNIVDSLDLKSKGQDPKQETKQDSTPEMPKKSRTGGALLSESDSEE